MLSLFLLGVTFAAANTVQFQFFDPAGDLLTDADVVVVGQGIQQVFPAESDGTFEIPVEPGTAVSFKVQRGGVASLSDALLQLKVPLDPQGPIPIVVPFDHLGNDDCSMPVDLGSSSANSNTPDSTNGATPEPDNKVPLCGGLLYDGGPGVWFQVTGDGSTISASTCSGAPNPSPGEPWTPDADHDTKLHVYCLDCQEPTCVAGNDDDLVNCPFPGPTQFRSTVNWCSTLGVTYRILVSGFGGVTGDFTLAVGSNGIACSSATDCSATGACCQMNEPPFEQSEVAVVCEITTQGACEAAGGTYAGDDSACETVVGLNEFHSDGALFISIPDGMNNPPTPGGGGASITSVINVGPSFTVSDVNVNLEIRHIWIGDLNITVTSPSSTVVNIWHGDVFTGGTNPCTFSHDINATADDDGTANCAQISSGPIHSVFYSPAGVVPGAGGDPLATFTGEPAQGNWTLTIFDDTDSTSIATGLLNFWGLDFSQTVPQCPPFSCSPGACTFLPDGTCGVGPCQFDPTTVTCNPCPADPSSGPTCANGIPHDDDESDDEDDGDDSDQQSEDADHPVTDLGHDAQGGGSQQLGLDSKSPTHTTERPRPASRR